MLWVLETQIPGRTVILHSSACTTQISMVLRSHMSLAEAAEEPEKCSGEVLCVAVLWKRITWCPAFIPTPVQQHGQAVYLLGPQCVRGSTWLSIGTHDNERVFSSLLRKGLDDHKTDHVTNAHLKLLSIYLSAIYSRMARQRPKNTSFQVQTEVANTAPKKRLKRLGHPQLSCIYQRFTPSTFSRKYPHLQPGGWNSKSVHNAPCPLQLLFFSYR